jgi:hypothetical protein
MSAADVVTLFRELGFPAAVAIFVLWRLEARLKEIADKLGTVAGSMNTLIRIGDETNRTLEKSPPPFPLSPPGRSDRGG